jgi:hypothetical protein
MALQTDQTSPQTCRQHLCDLGLANARFALEKQGFPKAEGQKHHRGQRPCGDIALPFQQRLDRVDRAWTFGHSAASLKAWLTLAGHPAVVNPHRCRMRPKAGVRFSLPLAIHLGPNTHESAVWILLTDI